MTELELQLQEKESIIEECSRKFRSFSGQEAALNEKNREIELLKMEVRFCDVARGYLSVSYGPTPIMFI